MSGIVEAIFGFCCFLIAEIGLLFGVSYEAINVIAFCYVEPIFTGIMVLLAILAICKVPVKKVGTWFFWIVVGCVITLMIAGIVRIIKDSYLFRDNLELLTVHLSSIKVTSLPIANKYRATLFWLQDISFACGISYELVNILLYVVAMPVLCIISYIVIRKRKCTVK